MTNDGELRATADQLLEMVETLRRIEARQRYLELGSDDFVAAASEAAAQGRIVSRWVDLQLEMARDAAGRRAPGGAHGQIRLIDVVPHRLDRILAKRREAELRLETAQPGSDEARAAAEAIERLRWEYQVVAGRPAVGAGAEKQSQRR